jgi:hypothetical protein
LGRDFFGFGVFFVTADRALRAHLMTIDKSEWPSSNTACFDARNHSIFTAIKVMQGFYANAVDAMK